MQYEEVWYQSDDGLKLFARDYPNPAAKLTLLCLHGLSRNAADFHDLACDLQGEFRIVSADQRGRGRSQWDANPANYTPIRYVRDMNELIKRLELRNVVLVGTSMGGLMSMIMAILDPLPLRGVVLNDIGPEVDPVGLARILSYVGKQQPALWSWADVAERVENDNRIAFPNYRKEDWDRWARRNYGESESGEFLPLFDPAIGPPLVAAMANAPPDPWPVFEGLKQMPVLLIRGALSDVLEAGCAQEMARRHGDLRLLTVPDVGHAPMLDEPGVVPQIREFLAQITGS